MLETLQGDLGCNRRIGGQLVYLSSNWLYFTTFRQHVYSASVNTKVWTVIYPLSMIIGLASATPYQPQHWMYYITMQHVEGEGLVAVRTRIRCIPQEWNSS